MVKNIIGFCFSFGTKQQLEIVFLGEELILRRLLNKYKSYSTVRLVGMLRLSRPQMQMAHGYNSCRHKLLIKILQM